MNRWPSSQQVRKRMIWAKFKEYKAICRDLRSPPPSSDAELCCHFRWNKLIISGYGGMSWFPWQFITEKWNAHTDFLHGSTSESSLMDSSAGLSFLRSLWSPPASPAECRHSNVQSVRLEDRSHLPVHIRRVKYREAFEQWQLCSCSPLITNSPGGQCGLHNSVTPTRPEKPH